MTFVTTETPQFSFWHIWDHQVFKRLYIHCWSLFFRWCQSVQKWQWRKEMYGQIFTCCFNGHQRTIVWSMDWNLYRISTL